MIINPNDELEYIDQELDENQTMVDILENAVETDQVVSDLDMITLEYYQDRVDLDTAYKEDIVALQDTVDTIPIEETQI